jgi:type I restriction enzyme, S subunit
VSFPRYPTYKESGVEWLGEVPATWRVVPCRAIVANVDERNEAGKDQNYLSLMANIGIIPYEEKGDVGNKKPEDLAKCKIVKKGNLVINSMNYAIGSYGMSAYDGVCSPVYVVLRVDAIAVLPRYALRIFENQSFQKYIASFGNGILAHRAAIGWDDIKAARIVIPSRAEQQAVLTFLDRETAKIEALVGEQQRLIELLNEKRQVVISRAVTKGLSPHAPTKPSGIEWLGDVPNHWDVWKLAHAFTTIGSGTTPDTEAPEYYDGGDVPWVNTGDLNDDALEDCGKRVTPLAIAQHPSLRVYPVGSVVIAMYGATIGKLAILRFPATVNQACCVFAESSPIISKFLFYWLRGFRERIVSLATGGGQPNINQDTLRSLRVACPDNREQAEIVSFLDRETERIDALMGQAQQAINLLQERRTALISAAVTGKIDVCGLVNAEAV